MSSELIVEALAKMLWAYANELVTMDTWETTAKSTQDGFRLQARELITKGVLDLGREEGPKSGLALIAAERRRQIAEEDVTAEQDDKYTRNELVDAALCYAAHSWEQHNLGLLNSLHWPFTLDKWKPRDKKDNLIRAGAFIAAEIDRLSRPEAK